MICVRDMAGRKARRYQSQGERSSATYHRLVCVKYDRPEQAIDDMVRRRPPRLCTPESEENQYGKDYVRS